MAKATRIQPGQLLMPSVLDRLLDEDPQVTQEPTMNRTQVLRELRETVRRDLEMLLNTRIRNLVWPGPLKELNQSLLNFGIPDFAGLPLATSEGRTAFAQKLQGIIRQYEPRFKTVKVQLVSNAEPLDRTLRFRIDALLNVEPAPEPVVFDSIMHANRETIEVKGVGG